MMPSALKTMVFAAAILVIFLAGTAGFPVSRSRPSHSRKLSTTVDTSSLMSTPKGHVHKSAGVYEVPLNDDSIPLETEAIIRIKVTKQDMHKSAGLTIEQQHNVNGNFLEYNNELGAIQTPWSSELHHLSMENVIQPEHWLLVKDFIMDDYLFGELDESSREYFLRRILSGLIMSQQTSDATVSDNSRYLLPSSLSANFK